MNIRKTILIPMVFLTVLCSVAVIISSVILFNNDTKSNMDNIIQMAEATANKEIDSFKAMSRMAAVGLAENSELVDAIGNKDTERILYVAGRLNLISDFSFCTVTDENGIVLARTHEPNVYGDDISWQQSTANALVGKTETAYEWGEVIRLSMRTGVPVYNRNNELVGTVSVGFRLDSSAFVNEFKSIAGCEYSFYWGNELVSTTAIDDNGAYAIDTAVSAEIYETVMSGGTHHGEMKILGKSTITYYSPLIGADGEVVGIFLINVYKPDDAEITAFIFNGLIITLFVLAVCITIAVLTANTISSRFRGIMKDLTEAEERTQLILDVTPMYINTWTKDCKVTSINEEAVNAFEVSSKEEYLERFTELSPEFQPGGERSSIMKNKYIQKAFDTGYQRFEWMHQTLSGKPLPCEVILVRVTHKNEPHVIGFFRNLLKEKEMLERIREETKKSENLAHWYKSILNALPLPVSVTDNDMKLTFINTALERFMDVKHQDVLGLPCNTFGANICDTENCGVVCIKRGQNRTHFSHGDRQYQANIEILKDIDGKDVGFIEVWQDITAAGELAKKQAEMEETHRALDNVVNVCNKLDSMIYVTDPKTDEILFINDKLVEILGLDDDCIGRICYKVIQSEDMNGRCDYCPCYTLKDNPDETVVWEQYYPGTQRDIQHISRYITWPDGSIVHLQQAFDITEMKDVTKSLDKQVEQQALMTDISRKFLSGLDINIAISETLKKVGEFLGVTQLLFYRNCPDKGILSCEHEWLNPAYDLPSHIGGTFTVAKQYLDVLVNRRENVICLTPQIPEVDRAITPYRTGSSNYIITPIFIENELYGAVDYSREVGVEWTENEVDMIKLLANIMNGAFQMHASELDLITAKEMAEHSNRTKSLFLASMSHEIRTPMNAILGVAEIQLQEKNHMPDTEEAFNKIYDSGSWLMNIINDILDLSKIEAGKLELNPVKYDIPSLINDTVQLNRLRYESKPLTFKLDMHEDMPLDVYGDELRIKQVLNNVLSNAFKYTDKGEINMSVTYEADADDPDNITLVFKVSDTGQGMSEEQMEILFDEYTRFNREANRATVGTGLGMSITKSLVDLMSGEITVESEKNRGSLFTVRIPQKRIGTAICGAELTEKLRKLQFQRSSKMQKGQIMREYMPYGHVLVVDDVESNLYVAKGLMLPYGLKIEVVASGYEAIERIKNGHTYDVIFMDHMMPYLDGMETTKILREIGYNEPIVALTANAVTGQSEIFLANGFDGFISKPIDSREMNALLNDMIRDKQPPEVIEAARREKEERMMYGTSSTPLMLLSPEMVEAFVRDAEKAVPILESIHEYIDSEDTNHLHLYITAIHGMKSALANIGEIELSSVALKLEQAGRKGDKDLILSQTPALLSALHSVVDKIKPHEKSINNEISDSDKEYLREKLIVIKAACMKFNKNTAKDILTELREKPWPTHIKEVLEAISEYLLHSAFKTIVVVTENTIASLQ
ncbi:MAG: ATP-binding protein [Oscillospiraceae bacterium]|nr:ATP-binding protein [Oscillospiraceae bacterium]